MSSLKATNYKIQKFMKNIASRSKIEVNKFMGARHNVLKFCNITLKNNIKSHFQHRKKIVQICMRK